MKLYDLDHSPFAARVRMAIYAKSLPVVLVPPPGGALSAAYRAINPLGLVPALELDDGRVIAESEIIVEYLEDRFPAPPLRPVSAEDRARARLLARLADQYLADPLRQLFEIAKGTAPPERMTLYLGAIDAALTLLTHHSGAGAYAVGDRLSTADCALVPLLFFVMRAAPVFPDAAPLAPHPRLAAYWAAMAHDPVAARVLGELEAAQVRRAAARARGEPED
jgi:glutathione S-transferase